MIWTILLLVVGFVIMIKGGDWFVEAAIWVAEATGVPKMLVGATVVSLATTLPELFVSVIAVTNGATGLGVGNALGSVICNTGLILAISILVRPTQVDQKLFFRKALIMAGSLVILFLECLDGRLSAWESIPLFAILVYYIRFNIRHAKRSSIAGQEEMMHIDTGKKATGINITKFIVGATGIVVGAKLLVSSSTEIAGALGVSEGIIGVTIVALGTSLPELVTTITALKKRESAMGIGNILGANILNIVMILSTCALISKGGVIIESEYIPMFSRVMARSVCIDIPVAALLFILLIIPTAINKNKLKRFQGALMIGVYCVFIVFLALNA